MPLRCSHADRECRFGSANDHHAAGKSGRDGRPNSNVLRSSHGHDAAELPVAEERSEHRGRDFVELYDALNDYGRWRLDV